MHAEIGSTDKFVQAVSLDSITKAFSKRPFLSAPMLGNRHLMTIIGTKRPRKFSLPPIAPERREFQTEAETRVVAYCHWQSDRLRHPTILIIHGLEGSADAQYVLGTASKAFVAGFNVLRYNVRGCGGTLHLSPKLYHSGLTVDLHHVMQELIEKDELQQLFLIGFSMGGNQSLKLAGELGANAPKQLCGVCAISPPIDLETCSRAIARRENWIYEIRFLRSLQKTLREKDKLFPGIFDLNRLKGVKHLWDWDDAMQPYNGFRDAMDYYNQASSLPFIPKIQVPTLIIHAQDDPFIPFEPFTDQRLSSNPMVRLLATERGGHVAFCGRRQPNEDRAWAENRAVEFCQLLRLNG
ncbi:MAG: alpha/beta fold hydrolase [Acidobacteria bacterium]|nr:alpha/beta fold hydrolase [Acidobacteriota bacterium]